MLNLELTFILSVITVLFLIFNIKYRQYTKKIGFKLSHGMQNLSNKITDLLKGRLTIKVNAIEDEYSDQFQSINACYTQTLKYLNKLYARLESVNVVFTLMSSLVFIAVGAIYVSQNKTTFGTLVSLIALQESLTYGCLTASRKVPVVFENLASTRRICDFLNMPEYEDDSVNETPQNGIIHFENVDFAYDNNKLVFENMNFRIKKNQFTIIQGASGSGKSSLIKLLLGFYRPTGGKILIKDPTKMIAYVPQIPFLYSDTIKNNILYGKLNATDHEYDWAVKMAYADEVIDKLPDGDATLVENGGKNLSRGQCQRIALARALIKDSPILLLDEATASLDSISKRYIESVLEKLKHDKTVIMITHDHVKMEGAAIFYINEGALTVSI